jgi:hypothetical protein
VHENKVLRRIFGPKRDGMTGSRIKLRNEELHNFYSSRSIIRMNKSRGMRLPRHVARMMTTRNAYRLLEGNLEGKRPPGKPGCMWVVGLGCIDWIDLGHDRDQWRAFVNTVMNLRDFIKYWEVLEQLNNWRLLKKGSAP